MDSHQFWKNFSLGTELQIAGSYIYDGLKSFNDLESFYFSDEIFTFLYQIAVGIERLEKIAIILIEHDAHTDQDSFEKSLISHNHMDLLARIRKHQKINISNRHQKFLSLLSDFYKTMRYDRFNLSPDNYYDKEKQAFVTFLVEEMGVDYTEEFLNVTQNENKLRIKFGKLVGKICTEIYEIIWTEKSRLNINTTELRYDSKAAKIFYSRKFDFLDENILIKELLIYFVNTKDENRLLALIKELKPLDFDPALGNDYIECFTNSLKCLAVIDECEALYAEENNIRSRVELLSLLGDLRWDFMDDEEDENDE